MTRHERWAAVGVERVSDSLSARSGAKLDKDWLVDLDEDEIHHEEREGHEEKAMMWRSRPWLEQRTSPPRRPFPTQENPAATRLPHRSFTLVPFSGSPVSTVAPIRSQAFRVRSPFSCAFHVFDHIFDAFFDPRPSSLRLGFHSTLPQPIVRTSSGNLAVRTGFTTEPPRAQRTAASRKRGIHHEDREDREGKAMNG